VDLHAPALALAWWLGCLLWEDGEIGIRWAAG
jgi:hypothetical protein